MMNAGKSPGLYGVATDCLSWVGVTVIKCLVRLLNECFLSGLLPIEYRSACIVPLSQGKGHRNECSN